MKEITLHCIWLVILTAFCAYGTIYLDVIMLLSGLPLAYMWAEWIDNLLKILK